MPNYANAYDLLMCEPPDTGLEELAAEQAMADAWDELLNDGVHAGTLLDEYAADDQGEMLDLLKAYREGNQDDMTSAAYKIAARLEVLAEDILDAN